MIKFSCRQSNWFIFFPAPIILLLLPLLAIAEETEKKWKIVPNVTAGIMHYGFEFGRENDISDIQDKVNYSENLPFLGIGLGVTYDRFFANAQFQKTLTKEISDQGNYGVAGGSETLSFTRDTDLDRQEYSLSLGFHPTQQLSVAVGYKKATTHYDWFDQERDKEMGNVGFATKNNSFDVNGPFMSATYRHTIGPGALSVNFAFAKLDGEITTNRIHKQGNSQLINLKDRTRSEVISSDTRGVNLGIQWLQPLKIRKNLFYTVSANWVKYNYDTDSGSFQDNFFSNRKSHEIVDLGVFDVEETIFSLNASLIYLFEF